MKTCLLLLALSTSVLAVEPGFESLFDGKTLDGWKHSGNWELVNGEKMIDFDDADMCWKDAIGSEVGLN